MVRDAVRNYLGLAAGIGTLTQQRAVAAARALVSSGEATAEQVSSLADDLLATSKANREAVAGLVRVEIERALGRLGLATAEDVRALTARLAAAEGTARAADRATPARTPAKKATTKKATTKKATTKATKRVPAKKSATKATKRVPAKKAATRPAQKSGTSGGRADA